MAGVSMYRDEEGKQSAGVIARWEGAVALLVRAAGDEANSAELLKDALADARYAAVESHKRAFESRLVKVAGRGRFRQRKPLQAVRWLLLGDFPSPRAVRRRLTALAVLEEDARVKCGDHRTEDGLRVWRRAYDDVVNLSRDLEWRKVHLGRALAAAGTALGTIAGATAVLRAFL